MAEEKGLLAGCAVEGTNSQEQAHSSNTGRQQKDLGAGREGGRTHPENSDDVKNTTNIKKRYNEAFKEKAALDTG